MAVLGSIASRKRSSAGWPAGLRVLRRTEDTCRRNERYLNKLSHKFDDFIRILL